MTSAEAFSIELARRVARWEDLGVEKFADGARKIGRIRHAGPRAYLHTLMPPPAPEAVAGAESSLHREIPEDFRNILRISNGAYLFYDCVEMLGLPSALTRDPAAAPQPHSLIQYNTYSRPARLGAPYFVCGGYGFDGGNILLDETGAVSVCDRDGARVEQIGARLTDFLLAEFDRLSTLFDREGKLVVPEEMTTHPKLLLKH